MALKINSLFLRAILRGRTRLTRRMIEHGADVNAKYDENRTPIFYALDTNNLDLVRLLVEHGADISATTFDGETPLHEAAFEIPNSYEICKLLLERGADCNSRDEDLNTPFHHAV